MAAKHETQKAQDVEKCLFPEYVRDRRDKLSESFAASAESIPVSLLTLPRRDDQISNSKKQAPPDGGWGWVIVAAAFFVHIVIGQSYSMFTVLYMDLVEVLDAETGDIGWVRSVYGFSAYLAALPASIVSDIYGSRIVAILGSLLGSLGFFLGAFAPNVTVLCITYGVIGGAGYGSSFFVCMVIVQQYFDKRRGLAAALCLAGLSVGTMTGALIMQYLIDVYAWRGALMIISGIFLHIGVFAGFFRPVSQYQQIDMKHNCDRGTAADQSLCNKLLEKMGDFSVLRDLRLHILLVAAVLLLLAMTPFYSHTPNRAYFYGVDKQLASLYPSIYGSATLLSRICCAFFVDLKFVNRMLMYGFGIIALALSLGLFTLAKTFTTIAIFCFIIGFVNGVHMSVQATAMADMVGVDKFPRAQGIFALASSVGDLLATPLLGYIFDAVGNYDIPFLVAAVFGIASGILSLSVAVYDIYRTKRNCAKN